MKKNIIVAGIGTDVGKTFTSAILTKLFQADYWKPIQTGIDECCDWEFIKKMNPLCQIHPSIYSLKKPLSPDQAAKDQKVNIDINEIVIPKSNRMLIIEMAGGVLVPINECILTIDLFSQWDAEWILVIKDYLGCINHTLLTLEFLCKKNISPFGLIYNQFENDLNEKSIKNFTFLPILGKIFKEETINEQTIERYAQKWKQAFIQK